MSATKQVQINFEEPSEFPIHSFSLNRDIHWTMNNVVTGYPGGQLGPPFNISDLEFATDPVVLDGSPTAVKPLLGRITLFTA